MVPLQSQRKGLMHKMQNYSRVFLFLDVCTHRHTPFICIKKSISPVYLHQTKTNIRKQNSPWSWIFRESLSWYSGFPYKPPQFNSEFSEGRTHYTVQRWVWNLVSISKKKSHHSIGCNRKSFLLTQKTKLLEFVFPFYMVRKENP